MTKITQTEAIEKCAAIIGWNVAGHSIGAETFLYWCNGRGLVMDTEDYNPFEPTNLDQAFELLEKWIAADLHVRDYEATGDGEGGHLIMLVHERLTKGLKHWEIAGESSHKSPNAAIVLAVLQAMHGETYELAEGRV